MAADDLLNLPSQNPSWQDQAACRGATALFFPARGQSLELAKSICDTCPVKLPCKEQGLIGNEKFGIWGGLSDRERRKIRSVQYQASRRASAAAQ